jgi:hypothetical protein
MRAKIFPFLISSLAIVFFKKKREKWDYTVLQIRNEVVVVHGCGKWNKRKKFLHIIPILFLNHAHGN